MLGLALALCAAASFGLGGVTSRRGMVSSSASQGLYVTVLAGLPLFLVASIVSGHLFKASAISANGYLVLAATGAIQILVARYCYFRAAGAFGANRTEVLQALQLPYVAVLAALLLDEEITVPMAMGTALIMTGAMAVVARARSPDPSPATAAAGPAGLTSSVAPTSLVPRQAEGYFFTVLAALAYGSSALLFKAVLGDQGLGTLGGLVSYGSAGGLLALGLLLPRRLASLQGISGLGARWFLLTAVIVFLANVFRYIALSLAPVTIVMPLIRTAAVFVLLFSFLINRRIEFFGVQVVAGVALVASGSVLLALQA